MLLLWVASVWNIDELKLFIVTATLALLFVILKLLALIDVANEELLFVIELLCVLSVWYILADNALTLAVVANPLPDNSNKSNLLSTDVENVVNDEVSNLPLIKELCVASVENILALKLFTLAVVANVVFKKSCDAVYALKDAVVTKFVPTTIPLILLSTDALNRVTLPIPLSVEELISPLAVNAPLIVVEGIENIPAPLLPIWTGLLNPNCKVPALKLFPVYILSKPSVALFPLSK